MTLKAPDYDFASTPALATSQDFEMNGLGRQMLPEAVRKEQLVM
jgi:hypothetical protein